MKHYELILYRTYADLKAEAARGYLGMLWWIIEPLLYLGMFSFFFIYVRHQDSERVVPFLLIGLVAWRWFASTLPSCANSISGGRNLMRLVYLPKHIFPWVAALTNFVKFLIVFSLLLLALLCLGVRPTAAWCALPLLIGAQFLFMLGVGGLVASVVPFVPDLSLIVNNMLMPLFFLSGVLFDIKKIPDPFQPYALLNPLAVLIAEYRSVLIDGQWPVWTDLTATCAAGALCWAVACAVMRRYDRVYPKALVR